MREYWSNADSAKAVSALSCRAAEAPEWRSFKRRDFEFEEKEDTSPMGTEDRKVEHS